MRKKNVQADYTLVNSDDFNVVEAYKVLRTNLEFSIVGENSHKVIMVTSSVPQEGKTHIAANLSVFLTQIGYKVLLMDCDLRKPKIHRFFNLSNKTGITNIVFKKALVEDVINEVNPKLYVLCSGPTPPNAVEILSSKGIQDLVKSVSSQFDYVLIDTPPAAFLSDASVLAPITNGVLYVIKHSSTPIDVIKQGIDNLKKANANIIGAIFSQVEMSQFGGHYHYKYMDQYSSDDKAKSKAKKPVKLSKPSGRYNSW
jgi:capsular exopolysaccharide synthesis family protein